ncbi:MAG: TIGR04282 family arsenosugar biosynthesis glycosyltransferase [Gammaproteobacteria bacterium]|nr:TIGR04282 family arsenosugar biosynthesis glycosyltransferase [Gammaproteobacteria bacterium]
MQFPEAVILVFAKAPIAGEVKTRLIPALGTAAATDLHAQLVRHTLTTVVYADICPVQLWCAPDTTHPFFAECQRNFAVTLHTQQGSDLGARMVHAFDAALQEYRRAVIIGSDCPLLTAHDITTTLSALRDGYNAVLGPAQDGGYVLLGLKQAPPALFDNIPWGTANVLVLTRERLQQLQWRVTELAPHWDVDRPEDLAHPFMQKLLLEISPE